MTNPIIRQNIGIDISKASISVCIAQKLLDQSVLFPSSKSFENTLSGFEKMNRWIQQFIDITVEVHYTMEATGVYYESLAYWLFENQKPVSVILAKQFKSYAQSLNIQSKTDGIDARILAQMGVERKLSLWSAVSGQMRQLKQLSRERNSLMDEQTAIKNQLHALKHSYQPDQRSIGRIEGRLALIAQQIKEIQEEMSEILANDPALKERIANVCTIKGVSLITAIAIIAETNGFALFHSRSQLVAYAGYDVVRRQSGTSINAPTKISKKGNKHIRKTLYFPALSAAMHEPAMKKTYQRITEKTNIKMKGAVAIQRRLLVLIYTLFKNNQPYDPN
ncbi:IS110 family transposase [Emticicia sp. TH156]|uniref:IS110 family transposase n=1 Tax=Emticicia sp. TH156 TaxID=2067454 RepID=UPI000C785BDD|nr:IS110 family transposase [Emticicia sp. TH156]PLK43849.1 IS110 family transposase [Emticicia sp. TH156]